MDTQTFCQLRNQYHRRLLCSMIAMVKDRDAAEDITAAAFAVALKNRDSFRGEASFYTWLYRIAVNEAINSQRRNRSAIMESIDAPQSRELMTPDLLSEVIDRRECCARLRKALRLIPTKYRRVLVDHFVRGYSTKRIARDLRIPLNTVLSRIFNGKSHLRQAWRYAR
jgi:RNA polymerase sigma-70 factor, ECF subfamily